jgi:uncharacterized RDD family membrane protein YckC
MEDITLQTTENISLRYDIATAGSRSAAFLIDYIIILLVVVGLNSLIHLVDSGDLFSSYFIAVIYLVTGTLLWVYFVISETVLDGSSIGKRILGIRVIKEDGSPIDSVDSLTRNFIRYVDLLPGTCLVGFVVMMLNERSKRLGDYAAGTIVVRVKSVQPDRVQVGDTPYDEVVKGNPHLSLITPEEYQLVRDYMTQRYRLSSYKSFSIADKLASRIAQKLDVEPPRGTDQCVQFLISCIKYYEGT